MNNLRNYKGGGHNKRTTFPKQKLPNKCCPDCGIKKTKENTGMTPNSEGSYSWRQRCFKCTQIYEKRPEKYKAKRISGLASHGISHTVTRTGASKEHVKKY